MSNKSMQLNTSKISFIGAGNMASAIIEGLIENGVEPGSILASDPSPEKLDTMQARLGIGVTTDNAIAVSSADVVVLAVKPQVMAQVIEPLKAQFEEKRPVVVSIAAGIEMQSLQNWLGATVPVVRCMPNTPAQVLEGASGLFANAQVSDAQKEVIEAMFAAVGYATWVEDESLIHAVTAISGSGPAYFFLMISEMAKAGEVLGLEADSAKRLAAQTALGAAKMVLESDLPAEQLKRNVMSPGGTTERAIHVFENDGLPELVSKAMTACADRSKEMAELLGDKKGGN